MKHFWLVLLSLWMGACGAVSPETQRNLFQDAQSARATSDAQLQQAQFLEGALTATAQAPIVHITETAAGIIVQQTQNSMDSTSTAAQWTDTPTMTPSITSSPTANATSTKVFAVLDAEMNQIANDVARDNLELQRQADMNDFYAKLPGITFALVAGGLIMGLVWLSRRERYRPAQVDERGNLLPVFDFVEGTVTDPDRMPNYRGDLKDNLYNLFMQLLRERLHMPPQLPAVTEDRQDAVTHQDQVSDMAIRGVPHTKTDGKKAAQQLAPPLPAPGIQGRFKILEEGTSNLDVIDGEIIEVLDQVWKEADQK